METKMLERIASAIERTNSILYMMLDEDQKKALAKSDVEKTSRNLKTSQQQKRSN